MRIALISLLALSASAIASFIMIPPTNPLVGLTLYTPHQSHQPTETASIPQATWLTGTGDDQSTLTNILSESTKQNKVPVVVLYNIPHRDCDSYSAGGAPTSASYRQWVNTISDTLKSQKIILIVEPDALAGMDCLSKEQQSERYDLLSYASSLFSQNKNAYIYIDAGHSRWHSADEIATRLQKAGIEHAQGFALNVSNFFTTEEIADYGKKVARHFFSKKSFVIDTSRNGNGPAANLEWCNPRGRALGTQPTTNPDISYVDALLWVKPIGESDGNCNGGPKAGEFWPQYAQELISNSKK